MSEFDDEREVSQRYRGLPAEEPPARLDEAIRAKARVRRWYFPVAAAAVLVLAVAVTWQVERGQPEPFVAAAPPPTAAPAPAPAEPARAPKQRKAEVARDASGLAKEQVEEHKAREERAQPRLGAAARSDVMAQRAPAETPEQLLERIAKLRGDGRHEEADKALAEFRRRYPDFKLSAEMREKVEKK